jgi:hypothetical protein
MDRKEASIHDDIKQISGFESLVGRKLWCSYIVSSSSIIQFSDKLETKASINAYKGFFVSNFEFSRVIASVLHVGVIKCVL